MSRPPRNKNLPKKQGKGRHAPGNDTGGQKAPKPRSFGYKSRDQQRSRGVKPVGPLATPRRPGQPGRKKPGASGSGATKFRPRGQILWGFHACAGALANPKRSFHRIIATEKVAARLDLPSVVGNISTEITEAANIDTMVPAGAAHQGIVIDCNPLDEFALEDLALPASGLVLVLDQITDPHNVGAMFRLASAFGARGIIMQSRHAPPLSGACAKVAVGTIETVPFALVTNIGNTLLALQKHGWMVTGLAGETDLTLADALAGGGPHAIVMGAEGPGLRRRVRDCCDQLAKIPMMSAGAPGTAESLNVSTAAAIALYEAVRSTQ